MAGTLADMRARIAGELGRTNLTSQINDAIATAISEYQKDRFRFSDVNPANPPSFNTVAGRWVYDSADNANIGTIMKWDSVNLLMGGQLYELDHAAPEEIKTYNETGTGQGFPSSFAYEGNRLIVSPVPDQIYTLSFAGALKVPAPASDAEVGNFWMTDAELLIRSRAKAEIAAHVTRNPTMAAAMYAAAAAAWSSLKSEASKATGRGVIRPTQF